MKTVTYTIQGTAPMLMHGERLANPFDDITKAIKAISGKRKKTEDDLLEMAQLEWRGGLYYNKEDGVHVPGYNMLACIINGGKLHKLGTAIKRAAIIQEDAIGVQYDGPKDPEKMFADKRFVDMRIVKIGTSKIMRCRPSFPLGWKCTFSLIFDENSLQRGDIDRCIESAGLMVGLGDYRPRFGRFKVVKSS